jgi:hypothetical protein
VALSAATAVVGAFGVKQQAGAVWVYVRSGASWRRQAKLVNPGGTSADEFGAAVAVSPGKLGMRALIGAPNAGRHICGTAYDFARSGTRWRERPQIANPGCAIEDYFGNRCGALRQVRDHRCPEQE